MDVIKWCYTSINGSIVYISVSFQRRLCPEGQTEKEKKIEKLYIINK